ncbi:unnamed protein product [Meloidogyne enterolobii]|uniref:Uncharacterized protein n=1 Tax=Meloidogyne enterolobii TaxID=390850 RepID=A0ACB1B716_MELEN
MTSIVIGIVIWPVLIISLSIIIISRVIVISRIIIIIPPIVFIKVPLILRTVTCYVTWTPTTITSNDFRCIFSN